MVELNRNHYFAIGVILLLLGIQLRMVDTYVLNEHATRLLANQFGDPSAQATVKVSRFLPVASDVTRKAIQPPIWVGYLLMSVGTVLMLHALAMDKPGGGGGH